MKKQTIILQPKDWIILAVGLYIENKGDHVLEFEVPLKFLRLPYVEAGE